MKGDHLVARVLNMGQNWKFQRSKAQFWASEVGLPRTLKLKGTKGTHPILLGKQPFFGG